MTEKIKIGISTCLLGENVRYDGGHQLDRYIVNTLGEYLTFVPVCPEVESGFGTPREAFRLVGDPSAPRLMTARTKKDCTDKMRKWARKRIAALEEEDLCAFIFKARSPSSGMERVKVYRPNGGAPEKKGTGIFARAFMDRFPRIPVEEDGRLHDPALRENFVERIFAFHRWREGLKKGKTRGNLVRFHTAHKLLLLSHSVNHYRLMGKIVAQGKTVPAAKQYEEYETLFMEALRLKGTVKKHTNVLHHIMGYFKKNLTADEKQEILEVIENYRAGHFPLIVPITLLNHFVRKYDEPYLKEQVYLRPHPIELQLRNHV